MELTDTQKKTVAAWFAAGASLDEIQKRIKAEFGVHMTYLDVRLMVAELPQPEEAVAEPDGDAHSRSRGTRDPTGADGQKLADEAGNRQESNGGDWQEGEAKPLAEDGTNPEGQAVSAPTVTIDALMIPGTIASGDVTFSDGQKGKWFIDQMGRLGLNGDLPQDYRPTPTDAALFQQQLMQLLQSKGIC